MNSQITLLAFGASVASPSGGNHEPVSAAEAARPTPSSASMAPRARPVKPMPASARNVRRCSRPQGVVGVDVGRSVMGKSGDEELTDRDEIVVADQHVDQVLQGP